MSVAPQGDPYIRTNGRKAISNVCNTDCDAALEALPLRKSQKRHHDGALVLGCEYEWRRHRRPLLRAAQRTWGIGLNYTFGRAMVGFVFTQTQVSSTLPSSRNAGPALASGSSLRFNSYEINGRYAVTPAPTLSAQLMGGSSNSTDWGARSGSDQHSIYVVLGG